ncbi:hypothetical protein [Halalkalibacter krulwichiae]|uniref:Uncharacterized protein n=1 Tax=Halalkalibacter krulwichiae TaxID=199441 RepID=A0A1X9MJN6_9BACI|nr:hypothetical protein [Halalkalibacter krulwichiae]ARK31861.1 hypothetical protein BkAM31D_19590 [Halalkalibacter krulwichiae]
MEKLFVGFHYVSAITSFVVTLPQKGESKVISYEDFRCFFVETGFVSSNAMLGGAYVETEILEEFDFDINGVEGVELVCAS